MTTATETMNEATKKMLRDWVRSSGGNPERAAKWAQRNMKAISNSIAFWREQIAEALKGAPAPEPAFRIAEPDVRNSWGCDNVFGDRTEWAYGS